MIATIQNRHSHPFHIAQFLCAIEANKAGPDDHNMLIHGMS